ncbi:MAG: carboxypeptidase-like regulatory domain-containing protein [Bacteroidetes bacterium]|nr:carboxypeptidase-like regulatory domain-containing protein [Bacteroidota bacterium]
MKNFILAFLFVTCTLAVYSQTESYYISGTVINKETNQPMVGASVFAQNTTIGTATNAEGKFSLQLPAGGYDIIVTFTGFNAESKRVTASDPDNRNLSFELKLKEKEMEAVAVVATTEVKDGFKKYGNFFIEHFIGKTENSANCTIKNPEVLRFFYSKKKNRLKVLANDPILIENKALGYNIKYTLDSFAYTYETQVAVYTGYPLFEEMTPTNSGQLNGWITERQKAYKGSILHFMRSIYNQRVREEGFEIRFLVSYGNNDTAFTPKNIYAAINYRKDDSTQVVSFKPNQNLVGVLYTKEKPAAGYLQDNKDESKEFQFSILNFLPGEYIHIEQNGYHYEQNDISISEYWTWDKVADQLPYDYIPTE